MLGFIYVCGILSIPLTPSSPSCLPADKKELYLLQRTEVAIYLLSLSTKHWMSPADYNVGLASPTYSPSAVSSSLLTIWYQN